MSTYSSKIAAQNWLDALVSRTRKPLSSGLREGRDLQDSFMFWMMMVSSLEHSHLRWFLIDAVSYAS